MACVLLPFAVVLVMALSSGPAPAASLRMMPFGMTLDEDDSDVVPVSSRKVWQRNTLFGNPDNWEDGVVPCPGDSISFPRNLHGSFAYIGAGPDLNSPVEVRELELPWSGTVAMPKRGSLVIGGEESRTRACPGKVARWRVRPTPPSWLDPANWRPHKSLGEPKDLEARPHLERIPCGQDVATFDTEAFQVSLPEFPVRVGGISIAKSLLLSPHRWLLLTLGDNMISARQRETWEMRPSDSLQLMAYSANDLPNLAQQCGLGTHQGLGDEQGEVSRMASEDLHDAVCQHVTCPLPACSRPVRPYLHCCYVCGVVLELRPLPAAAVLEEVRAVVRAEALQYESRWGADARPAIHMGAVPSPTTDPGLAQIVLLGDNAEDLAGIVLAAIQHSHESLKLTLLASGAPVSPATVGSVLALLTGTLFLVLVVLLVLIYHHERTLPLPSRLADFLGEKRSAFLFARFENAPGEEDGAAVVNVVKYPPGVRSARGSWSARSFRNPLYERDEDDDGDGQPLPLQPPQRGLAHENPLFSELQRRVDEDGVHGNGQDHVQSRIESSSAEAEDPTLGVRLVDIAL